MRDRFAEPRDDVMGEWQRLSTDNEQLTTEHPKEKAPQAFKLRGLSESGQKNYLLSLLRRLSSPKPTGLPTRVIAQRKPMAAVLWRSSR